MNLLEALNWRYAAKRMNGEKVPAEKINNILEAARLAPTSGGFQPFGIINISNRELLEKVKPVAFNQAQITECSNLLVFCAHENVTAEHIAKVVDYTVNQRSAPAGSMDDYKNRMTANFTSKSAEENFNHAARQAYIAFGLAIAEAALLKVDATPMEGFNNVELDKLLNLKEKGLRSVCLLAVGYRDEQNDWLSKMKKVRRPLEELVIEMK